MSSSTRGPLWAGRLSMTTVSPGESVGTRHVSTQSSNRVPPLGGEGEGRRPKSPFCSDCAGWPPATGARAGNVRFCALPIGRRITLSGLRRRPTITASSGPRGNGIVPLWVEGVAFDVEACHFLLAHFDPFWVSPRVELAPYRQAGLGRGGGDEFDHRQTAGQGRSPPVLGDVAEQPVLNLVPLRRPRRVMADLQGQSGLVGELLQFDLEQPHARSVGTAAIGGYHDLVGARIPVPTHQIQPAADRVDRELRRIIVDAHAHTAGVGGDVIYAIRYDLAEFGVDEVMHLYRVGTAFRPVVAAGVLVGADWLVSRPAGFRRQPLSERCVRLSPQTAPIRRTRRSFRYANVRRGRGGSEPASRGNGPPQPYVPEIA